MVEKKWENITSKYRWKNIKVILDGWVEDVMVNGYVCSATSIYFEA